MVALDHLVTSGTFSLDGGTWEVDNNVWLLGDEAECVVIDAPHDADAIRAAVGPRPGGPSGTSARSSPRSATACWSWTPAWLSTPATGTAPPLARRHRTWTSGSLAATDQAGAAIPPHPGGR